MASKQGVVKLHERIEKSQVAIARFAAIVEEYRALRSDLAPGPARQRLEELIKLNEDTAAILKRSLVITEGDLSREERRPAD